MTATTETGVVLPFLKWAGGKRKLGPAISALLPRACDTYYEPFVGGGAIYFSLPAGYAEFFRLADTNAELIRAYGGVRKDADRVSGILRECELVHSEAYYYRARLEDWSSMQGPELAARMIYLNRAGFNGLYRVNQRGGFNVPWGKRERAGLPSLEALAACSRRLNHRTDMRILDFEDVCANARSGDAVYFDPPYLPSSKTANFTSYTQDGFKLDDHERLSALFARLCKKGVRCILSMCESEKALEVYGSLGEVHFVSRTGTISSKGSSRERVGELLIAGGPVS